MKLELLVNNNTDDSLFDKSFSLQQGIENYNIIVSNANKNEWNTYIRKTDSDYVMFCEANDMLIDAFALANVYATLLRNKYDCITSEYLEEYIDRKTNEKLFIKHQKDTEHIYGKVFRREYIVDNDFIFDDINSSYSETIFTEELLCSHASINYTEARLYLHKYDNSNNLGNEFDYKIKSYSSLIEKLIKSDNKIPAQEFAIKILYETYRYMTRPKWNEYDATYRNKVTRAFKSFFLKYRGFLSSIPISIQSKIINDINQQYSNKGVFMPTMTFNDWIGSL